MQRPATGESWVKDARSIKLDERITRATRDVYNALLDMCTKANNVIRISTSALARRAVCCEKTVFNAIKSLEKYRYIDRVPKAWRTETNTFKVFKILPDKKRSSFKSDEQPDSMPVIQSKPRKPRAEKPKKKKYGEYGRVRLTDEEYNSLLNDFGQEITIRYIQRADDYSQEHKRYYNNNAVTIRKWIEDDKKKPNRRHNYHKKDKYKDNKITDEEMAGYLRLVNRFRDDDIPASEPVSEPVSKLEPKPDPISESEEYQMTDEEISCVLRYNCDMIRDSQSHPLHNCTVLELLEIAKRQQKQRNSS